MAQKRTEQFLWDLLPPLVVAQPGWNLGAPTGDAQGALSPIYSRQKIISEDFLYFCSNPRPLLGSDCSRRTAGILQYHKKHFLTPTTDVT